MKIIDLPGPKKDQLEGYYFVRIIFKGNSQLRFYIKPENIIPVEKAIANNEPPAVSIEHACKVENEEGVVEVVQGITTLRSSEILAVCKEWGPILHKY